MPPIIDLSARAAGCADILAVNPQCPGSCLDCSIEWSHDKQAPRLCTAIFGVTGINLPVLNKASSRTWMLKIDNVDCSDSQRL
jgi:hypothetical protein